MQTKLTANFVRTAPVPNQGRVIYWDERLPGFGLMVTATGHRSFVVQYRAGTISRRYTIKDVLSVDEARKKGKQILGAAAKGGDPVQERRKADAAAQNTLQAVATEYVAREGKRLRSMDQREAMLERLVYPKLGTREIDSIGRRDVVKLLDKVEDERGPVMADHVLATLRRLMTWHASRSDDYRSPIVRGMARTKPKERARRRILSDDELRAVWKTAEAGQGPFDYLVRFILLTTVRRNEAAKMNRAELSDNDWVIPAARHKSKRDFLIPMSKASATLLAEVPAIGNGNIVFSTDGKRAIGGFSKFKADFDARCKVTGWTLHDLRRTSRSLLSRAGVNPDHAERVLAHALAGVRGVYDLHEYKAEKANALEALAAQIERIVNPAPNVVALRS